MLRENPLDPNKWPKLANFDIETNAERNGTLNKERLNPLEGVPQQELDAMVDKNLKEVGSIKNKDSALYKELDRLVKQSEGLKKPTEEVPETELPSVIVDPEYLTELESGSSGSSDSVDSIRERVSNYIEQNQQAPKVTEETKEEWEVSRHLDLNRLKQPKTEAKEDVQSNSGLNESLNKLLKEDKKLKEPLVEEPLEETKFPAVSMEDINSISPRDSGLAEQSPIEDLNSENKKLHDELPPKGKKMTERIFDVIHKIPGINRVVGKLEIAYNQSRADKNREVNDGLKNEMWELSKEIAKLEKEYENISKLNLKLDNKGKAVPIVKEATYEFDFFLLDLQKEIDKMKIRREEVKDEFEERANKIQLHTAEVNRVVDTLIERYNEKIEPIKKIMAELQVDENKIDLREAVSDAMHEEQKMSFADIQRTKNEIMASLVRTGKSEKEIKNFGGIKRLDKAINEGMAKIHEEKADMGIKRSEMVAKIEKTKAKAGAYEGKVKEFERLRDNRPIETKIETKVEKDVVVEKTKIDTKNISGREEGGFREGTYEADKRLDVGSYINLWNAFLTKKYGSDGENTDFVKMDHFMEVMKDTGLLRSLKLDSKNFKNILGKYYKYGKIPVFSFKHNADEFFAKKINS